MTPGDALPAPPDPPPDPRSGWELPTPGTMPVVERLTPLLTRVLAPNPSPMTLDGTNTYLLSAPGSGDAVVVDPGPTDPGHRDRVEAVLTAADAELRAVLLTHHHPDHADAAAAWADAHGCPVLAPTPTLARRAPVLTDGQHVGSGDTEVVVIATPGHTRDHVAFRLADGAVLTGDHVLGRGTSVVAHPDGDLASYLSSLRRVWALGPDALHPGHGPSLLQDPGAVLEYYTAHRRFRADQVRHALATAGPADLDQLVAELYAEVDRWLWPAAAASLSATLAWLADRGELTRDAAGRCHLAVGSEPSG